MDSGIGYSKVSSSKGKAHSSAQKEVLGGSKKDDLGVADKKRLDCWTAPLDGIMKINIDSLWRKLDTRCVLAALVRSSSVDIQACLCKTTFSGSPLDGEGSSALLAVEVAEKLGLSTYVIETSSTELIAEARGEKLGVECAAHLQEKLNFLSKLSNSVTWSHVTKFANTTVRAATTAIGAGVCNVETATFIPGPDVTRGKWMFAMPPSFVDLVCHDEAESINELVRMWIFSAGSELREKTVDNFCGAIFWGIWHSFVSSRPLYRVNFFYAGV